jgi:DNA helicase-2/ATP-dependent DNA helicase PcrA
MAGTIDYVKDLNPSQLEAVYHRASPLLVLAGAGSGKTRVITYKIACSMSAISTPKIFLQ